MSNDEDYDPVNREATRGRLGEAQQRGVTVATVPVYAARHQPDQGSMGMGGKGEGEKWKLFHACHG